MDVVRRCSHKPALLAAILLVSFGLVSPGAGQEESSQVPDLAATRQQFEEAFAAALEMPEDVEPMFALQAWGAVLMSALMVDRVQAMTEGDTARPVDAEAVQERVLERWQRLRPESGGPDLLRAFRIQDAAEKRAAVVALADRYPDDPLVVWQATNELRQNGELGRATELAERFLERHPDHPQAYRILAQDAVRNETRLADVLERWARAAPGDPAVVSRWLGTSLPQRQPEATRRLLTELFARRPAGDAGLTACLQVAGMDEPAFVETARACVARIAGDPDSPPQVSARATSAMVEMAAADGEWSALMDALEALEPRARIRALIAAAGRLKAPERCGEAIDLLSAAAEIAGDDGGEFRSVASALRSCSALPAAEALYLALIRRAPADRLREVVTAWVVKVNGVFTGELPDKVAGVLEERLRADPDGEGAYAALDVVYQVADPERRRFDLLRRWHQRSPSSFGGEQAADLARELVRRNEPGTAVGLLEQQLESRFQSELAEMLWELYLEGASAERAERFAADLLTAGDDGRVRTGHALAARGALVRQDLAAAERHYWQALAGDYPSRDVALELLDLIGLQGDDAALEATARRICEETRLAKDQDLGPNCIAELLTRAGSDEAAAAILARSADLPEDLGALRKLAATAQSAGQADVAERALKRILELDPLAEAGWIDLGTFLERQGRVEELEDLLERSRKLFSPPPSYLYRAAGRALTSANPRRAIEVFLEARDAEPDTSGGEWSRSWIDYELQQAYRRLGEQAGTAVAATGPPPIPAVPTSEPPPMPEGDAPALRLAAEGLQSGEGGRYDPDAAIRLFVRAAAMGDAPAAFRLALLLRLGSANAPAGVPGPEVLYRRSAREVAAMAEAGDTYAQYLAGTAALVGLGGGEDYPAARRWFEAAAAGGQSWAWHNLAWMQETGRGFEPPDPAAALESYRKASAAGNTQSMVDVARLTLTTYGSGAPCEEGLRWLERAARAGNARAAAALGKVLFYGLGRCVASDPEASLEWLEAGAATHQPGATYDLAMALLVTGANAESRARGVALLERAAGEPAALAVEVLAFLHATGTEVARDPAKAGRLMAEAARLGSDGFAHLRSESRRFEVYRGLVDRGIGRLEELADRDDTAAMALLAWLGSVGLGGDADAERTASLALRAAAAGEALAMRVLSGAYQRGDGVETDPARALRWRRRCAESGDSFCMMFHGQDLIEGKVVERDLGAGLSWLRRSAEAGNWWAVADLGRLYDQGRPGLARDPDAAAAWKRRIAGLGDAEAAGWLLYHGYR